MRLLDHHISYNAYVAWNDASQDAVLMFDVTWIEISPAHYCIVCYSVLILFCLHHFWLCQSRNSNQPLYCVGKCVCVCISLCCIGDFTIYVLQLCYNLYHTYIHTHTYTYTYTCTHTYISLCFVVIRVSLDPYYVRQLTIRIHFKQLHVQLAIVQCKLNSISYLMLAYLDSIKRNVLIYLTYTMQCLSSLKKSLSLWWHIVWKYASKYASHVYLTHWGRGKMTANILTTISYPFSGGKYLNFDYNFTEFVPTNPICFSLMVVWFAELVDTYCYLDIIEIATWPEYHMYNQI